MSTEEYADIYDESIFKKSFFGIYGTFTPEDSPPLEYLLTNIVFSDFSDLNTAADITEFENVTFDELIQRDIDFERVDDELINNYLNKNDGDVKFFPPLLVSLVPTDNNHEKEKSTLSLDRKKLTTTFGGDKFQLELLIKNSPTPHKINYEGETLYSAPIATINVNLNTAKLVVIDGQHRFEALRRMSKNKEQRKHIERVQVPVCIFFTRRDLTETTNKDLRQLFVTINSKQREVSGHFLVLLDDKKLSSHVIRGLANKWKQELIIGTRAALPLLEWNTRQSRSAYRRQKNYSITTVSIISDCFSKYIFSDPKKGYTGTLLRFDEAKSVKSDLNFSTIDDSNFDTSDLPEIKQRLEKNIIAPLDILLRKPAPYSLLSETFKSKLTEYDKLAEKNVVGIRYYLNEIIYKYRKCSKQEQEDHKDAERKFENEFKEINEKYYIFFTLIFQQGLLRAWAKLAAELTKFGVSPTNTAEAIVSSLDELCFVESEKYFDPRQPYTQLSIYEGQRLLQNDGSRNCWVNLILMSILNPKSIKKLETSIKASTPEALEWKSSVSNLLNEALESFTKDMKGKIHDDLNANWKYKDLPLNDINELEEYSATPDTRAEYEQKIRSLAEARRQESDKSLLAAIGLKAEES